MNVVQRDFYGRTMSFESGRIAKQSNGSVVVRYGDSMVLVTACYGERKERGFLPLTVDYLERTYAGGKIPGGYFKREGKLTEREILISRLIDRPCRPLFPEGFSNEIQVVATVLSADDDNDTDVLAVCAASSALMNSELPFEGPLAAVRVCRISGKLVINPKMTAIRNCDLNFVIAGTRDAIVMVEGEAKEVPEDAVVEALFFAHRELQVLLDMQDELRAKVGKPKMTPVLDTVDATLDKAVRAAIGTKIKSNIKIKEKLARRDANAKLLEEITAANVPATADDAEKKQMMVAKIFETVMYEQMRQMVIETGERIDGRNTTTVRPISIEVGVLPRVHGSSLFQRGETQAIVAATLGTMEEAQRLDGIMGEKSKPFMLHYNFPGYSVGEVKPMRGPGRREIGHGFLAERALKAMMPDEKEFPYAVRIVSEIMESNGSSSMATVCGGALALMDAGVPLKAPVGGVAMGLIKEGSKFAVLTDILGDEDHLGDMDFKVCGTVKGITSIQMDIKIKGLSREIMEKALTQARDGRLHIMEKMREALDTPRTDLKEFAPRITQFKISSEKIRDLIGPGGKMIRSIQESTGVRVEVSDDGIVSVSSTDRSKADSAIQIIKTITAEAEIGKIYKGIVKRIADFGAFVEILPGTDGLVHISLLAEGRVNRVSDVLSEGDEVYVKVLDVDERGKIRLSLKDAVREMAEKGAPTN